MKKLILALTITIFSSHLLAQSLTPVDNGSAVKFVINNFGLNVTGSFMGLNGNVIYDPVNPAAASVSASVVAASINTGIASRDNHLRKESYFDIEKFPLISFVSSRISNSGKAGILLMEGNITIKGITKKVSFPFTVVQKGDGYLFAGEFQINRMDFGVGATSMVLSDNLIVSLSVLTKKN